MFCGKTRDKVQNLIAGPRGLYICDGCIESSAAALAEELPGWKETAELLAQREDKLKRRKAAPRKHTESGKRRK